MILQRMALQPTRFDFRMSLSNVDRSRELQQSVLVARHPSETHAHMIMRVLGWCVFNEEDLAFGPGLSTPEAADLWTRDATGTLTTWVECGAATAERLRKIQQHNPKLAMRVLMDDLKAATLLKSELDATKLPRAASPPTICVIERELVKTLCEKEDRRQKWTVTITGEHMYVDVDGNNVDSPIETL